MLLQFIRRGNKYKIQGHIFTNSTSDLGRILDRQTPGEEFVGDKVTRLKFAFPLKIPPFLSSSVTGPASANAKFSMGGWTTYTISSSFSVYRFSVRNVDFGWLPISTLLAISKRLA